MLLESLPVWRELAVTLPRSGIYFFYEAGEYTSHIDGFRIIRVGTHGAGRTLRQRHKSLRRTRNPKRSKTDDYKTIKKSECTKTKPTKGNLLAHRSPSHD